jgi:hypothetical protein
MSNTVQQAPGIRRTDLQRHDLSVPGREVIQNRVEIGPEAPFVKHKHPGEEIIYVLEGTLEYHVDGQTPTTLEVLTDACVLLSGHIGALQLLELGYTGPLAKRPRLAACERARVHGDLPGRA